MSTVTVKKSNKTGLVLNISTRNAEEAWVMVQSEEKTTRQGRIFINKRTGFLRSTRTILAAEGFHENQVLPGRVVIQDSIVPIMKDNHEFGLRIPQSKKGTTYTPAIGTAIRTACAAQGVSYGKLVEGGELKPIYRKTFYSPYPEGHANYEADVILTPDNIEAVDLFINSIALPASGVTGNNSDKTARLAELKAIAKNTRTADQKKELAMLVDELE